MIKLPRPPPRIPRLLKTKATAKGQNTGALSSRAEIHGEMINGKAEEAATATARSCDPRIPHEEVFSVASDVFGEEECPLDALFSPLSKSAGSEAKQLAEEDEAWRLLRCW